MNKSPQSQKGKEKSAFWLLNPASKFESLLLSLFFLLLPTQLGKHFWPDFTIVSGIRIDYLSPTLYVSDVLLILLFSLYVGRWVTSIQGSKIKDLRSKLQYTPTRVFYVLGFIFLLFIINIYFSSRPLLSLYGFIKILELSFVGFYLAKTIKGSFQFLQISFLFAISSLCESLLAIFQYLNQGSLNGIFYFFGERTFTGTTPGIANASIAGTLVLRPYATFPHPNVLAGYLLIAMVLVWIFVLPNKKLWIKSFAGIILLISSIALILTLSRIAILLWGALVLFVLARLLFKQLKTNRTRIIIGIMLVISLVIVESLPITHEVITRFSQTSLFEESVTERTELLSASWKMIQVHPLIGVGLDNFIPALAPLQKPLPLGLYLQPVHNIFVLVAVETGVIGFALFIWLLAATVIKIKEQESGVKKTFLVLLLIILVTGMFDHYWLTLQQGQLLFATILGLSWVNLE